MLRRLFIFSLCLAASLQAGAAEQKAEAIKKAPEKQTAVVKNSKDELKKQNLASLVILGVEGDLKKNLELHIPLTIPVCNAEQADVGQFFRTLKKRLRKAGRALGYYDAEFRSGGKKVNGCWKLRMRVKPGRPTKVVTQHIKVIGEGGDNKKFKELLKKLPYQKGDVLNHKKYSEFKARLSEIAESLGYFDAEFVEHSIKIDPLAYKANISLVLDTKKRYRYGKVTVDQDVLSENTMQHFLSIKTGDFYKTEDLISQQQFLQRSGYYNLIKIDVLHDQAKNQQIPIAITLKAKKRNAYKFKLGYGSDTGARVSAEMKRRWTGSKGKQLKITAQYAQNLSGISLNLISPRKNPEDDSLVYNIDLQKDQNDDVISRSIHVGGKLTRKRPSGWVQTASVGLLLDETQVVGEHANKTNLLLFGVGLEKVKADNLIFPNDGWRLKFATTVAAKGLLSDQNVMHFKALGKRVKQLGDGRLIGRVALGTTVVKHFDDLPKSLRFFAGGGNSVRGYKFESLGEINDEGKVIGGKHLLNLSLEYQYPIVDDWGIAAFIDAGNAFNNWKDTQLKVGLGVGARWRSPIGPVRVDIGFPKDDFKDPHLYLSVGSEL